MKDKFNILAEYGKCLVDPKYPIETYLTTFDQTQSGFVQFKLFPKQREIIDSYESNTKNIIVKPRQAGISTITAAYVAMKIAFGDPQKPESVLIVANKLETACEFLREVKGFVKQLPSWVKINNSCKECKDSESYVIYNNGCQAKAVAAGKDAVRGYTPTLLVVDEAAHIEKSVEFWTAAAPVFATGGKCIMISTPNGFDPLYYDLIKQARDGENEFVVTRMNWYEDPRYNRDLVWLDEKGELKIDDNEPLYTPEKWDEYSLSGYTASSSWFKRMCSDLGNDKRRIAQELLCSFQGSGGNVVDSNIIERHRAQYMKKPIRIDSRYKNMFIYEEPIVGEKYISAVDVSRGDGKDYSTMIILNAYTLELAVEYKDKVAPDMLAHIILPYLKMYGDCLCAIDITGGMGVATVIKLIELGYNSKKLYSNKAIRDITSDRIEYLKYTEDTSLPGFQVGRGNSTQRSMMIGDFEEHMRKDLIKIRSHRVLDELDTFIYDKTGKPNHVRGSNDDLIMCYCMALWIITREFKELERIETHTKAMIDAMTVRTSDSFKLPYKNNNNKNDDNDSSWLFYGIRR